MSRKRVKLFEVAEVTTGSKDANHATANGQYTFFTCAKDQLKSPTFSFDDEAIVLPGNGANVGEVFYYNGKFEAYQRTYVVRNIKIDPRYLYYHFLWNWRKVNLGKQFGSATNYIRIGNFEDYEVIDRPIDEQKRIVAKLDTLFGHLDQLKGRLEKIPALLKQFRQAVLTQAVTGKLTEEWRKDGPTALPRSWKYCSVSEVSYHILGKMLDANKNKGQLTYYLRNQNVRWGDFDLADVSKMRATDDERSKYSIKDGDILVCEGGEPGRSAVWRNGNSEFIFQKALHRLRCHDFMEPDWIVYNLTKDAIDGKLHSLFTGTTIKHLTLKSLASYRLPIPPLNEQRLIVIRVKSLLKLADNIEKRYASIKGRIDALTHTILSQAFRGGDTGNELKEPSRQADNLPLAVEP